MAKFVFHDRSLRAAVVGAGPAGYFTAESLIKTDLAVEVDIFERLIAPFGLLRYGVAPDHPRTKSAIRRFDEISRLPGVRFFGNVEIGTTISPMDLRRFYDIVIVASGAPVPRRLGIAGENLHGCHPAIDFVGWYNAHPDYHDRTFNLGHQSAVIVGHGNVALDVARIVMKNPDELAQTDIPQSVLDALRRSQVTELHIIGRRGPTQVAFSHKDFKELADLTDCNVVVNPTDLHLNESSRLELEASAVKKSMFKLLSACAEPMTTTGRKRIMIRFLRSPKEIVGNGSLSKIRLEKNTMSGPPNDQFAVGLSELEEIPCGLLFVSIGYRGQKLAGLPFDHDRGVIPTRESRIVDGMDGEAINGYYATGWIERGSVGLIGTNKRDSIGLTRRVLDDLGRIEPCPQPSRADIVEHLENCGVRYVNYDEWLRISSREEEAGRGLDKVAEKFRTREQMLQILDESG